MGCFCKETGTFSEKAASARGGEAVGCQFVEGALPLDDHAMAVPIKVVVAGGDLPHDDAKGAGDRGGAVKDRRRLEDQVLGEQQPWLLLTIVLNDGVGGQDCSP